MSLPDRHVQHPPRRLGEISLLSIVLTAGVGFALAVRAVFAAPGSGTGNGMLNLASTVPVAVVASWLGLRLTARMNRDRLALGAALNTAAVISLVFTVLMMPWAAVQAVIDRLSAASSAGTAVMTQMSGGLSGALLAQVVCLPALFVAVLYLGHAQAKRHAPGNGARRRRLPRFLYAASAAALIGAFGSAAGGMSFANASNLPMSTSSGTNPCSSAPHDTFNISAINVDIPLNQYGVHDPNGLMYVLNSQISAVRAEEASQQVSSGEGNDPIQPLVLRAHAGDCVTVNLTNATTFGLEPFDQPPPPDAADPCDPVTALNPDGSTRVVADCAGSLAHTAPQNIAWNVDGLPGLSASDVSSTVGQNSDNTAAPGQTVSYTVYMDPALGVGGHLFHTTGDTRQLQDHGLFGTLVEEPAGSSWLDPGTLQPINSGWKAVIQMTDGTPSYREFVEMFHEIGDEGYRQIMEASGATCDTTDGEVQTTSGCELPVVDPFTQAYRPCSKAINYRSECFFERLLNLKRHGFETDESQQYGSYMNGDMSTPRPEAYVGDPYKTILVNAGTEMSHVYHEHGGAIRWLRNPGAANPDFAGGLEKHPPATKASIRLDSQTITPGESYVLVHECGAGGCQQAAGDFLFHCHIAAHYIDGMLSFMRVFDTKQPNLATVPGRTPKPAAVTSVGLIGDVIGGKTVVPQSQFTDPSTQISLESLVESQLPPQGVPNNPQDATVWNWVKSGTSSQPLYLSEPESTISWPEYTPPNPGQRDPIMFDPSNGRYAWPLFAPHLGQRPPFSPNGHSGAPWLGPTASSTRPDGLCPSNAPVRTYNITAITLPIQETSGGLTGPPAVDQHGEIFVLNEDKAGVLNGTKPAVPLVVRSDVGDCIALTLTSELALNSPDTGLPSKVNMHIHFVQFDPQASDGVITGESFEQSVKPDSGVQGETTLTASAAAGSTSLTVADTTGLHVGISVEVGQGLPNTEVVNKITAISGNTLTLASPLQKSHASGEKVGVEFVQYRWYSDVQAGTVFFHDHVDGIHSWGHGLFAAHIIEPAGSTFHNPQTGATIRSGPIADIYTTGSAGFGESGDFREFVLFEHTGITSAGSPQGCEMSSFNLRSAPLIDRDPVAFNTPIPDGEDVSVPDGAGNYNMGFTANEEPAGADRVDCTNIGTANDPYVFSSVAHGDPPTPTLLTYAGDPVVIRQVGLDERVGDIRIDGMRFATEEFNSNAPLTDANTAGISEAFTYIINGGAGGPEHLPGDYLYYAGRSLELESGAWGIFRVMNTLHSSGPNALEPLPDRTAPPTGTGFPTLTFTGKAPPAAASSTGKVCPSTAPLRSYNVSIFNGITFDPGMPGESDAAAGGSWAMMYALSSDEKAIQQGKEPVVPLALRANAGDCLQITLHNDLPTDNFTWTWGSGSTRAGFNVGNVIENPLTSYGGAVGFDPDSSVAPGGQRTYSYYVDKELGTNLVLNMANESSWRAGAYGALIAEPKGSVWEDPFSGKAISSGVFADIFPPNSPAFREYVSIFNDREPFLGHSIMQYYLDSDHSYLNYHQDSLSQAEGADQHALCGTGENGADSGCIWQAKSDSVRGGADPATSLFEAYAGDPIRWRIANASGDNIISFQVSGHSFPLDHGISGSQIIEARTLTAGETFDAFIVNGAGGATDATGDFEYSVGRGPMIRSGDWGILRVFQPPGTTFAPTTSSPALLTLK